MEPDQYAVMARREDHHWWYAGMRQTALATLADTLATDDLVRASTSRRRILDAGCGTGGTTVELCRFGAVTGVDLAWEALRPARARGLRQLARGTIERLPFRDEAFELITSFEVVYHLGVTNDLAALGEFRRVLRPNGILMLRLPAHDWLRGEHDRLVHTRHRYTRLEVDRKLRATGFQPQLVSWANSLLFPAAAAKRLLLERARAEGSELGDAEPDLWQPPGAINAVLQACIGAEGFLLGRGQVLPFGLSVLAVARAA